MIILYLILLLILGFDLELILGEGFLAPMIIINIIVGFYIINRSYFLKFIKHDFERVIFNQYNVVFIIFLLINSYFYFDNYNVNIIVLLLAISYIFSKLYSVEKKIYNIFIAIIIYMLYYVVKMLLYINYLDGYTFNIGIYEINYIVFNTVLNISILLLFVSTFKNKLKINN